MPESQPVSAAEQAPEPASQLALVLAQELNLAQEPVPEQELVSLPVQALQPVLAQVPASGSGLGLNRHPNQELVAC